MEPVLEQYRPIILSSLKFSKFTLGTVAPQFTGGFCFIVSNGIGFWFWFYGFIATGLQFYSCYQIAHMSGWASATYLLEENFLSYFLVFIGVVFHLGILWTLYKLVILIQVKVLTNQCYFLGVSIIEDGESGITMELEMNWDGNPSIILDIKTRLGVSLPIQVIFWISTVF